MSWRNRAVAGTALVLLAACGGGSSPPARHDTSAARSATLPSPASASPSPPATPTDFTSSVFKPPFSVRLPAGWTVAERDEGAAQLYRECDTCTHGGEENGEITLDMGLQKKSLPAAIASLRRAANVKAGPTTKVKLGELSGYAVVLTRTGKGDVVFSDGGYDTDPTGAPLTVYALRANGPTITVILDPPRPGPAVPVFLRTASSVLQRMHFAG